jgi:hypothetical protein
MGIAMMAVMHFYYFTQPVSPDPHGHQEDLRRQTRRHSHPWKTRCRRPQTPIQSCWYVRCSCVPVHIIFLLSSLLTFIPLAAGQKTDAAAIAEAEKKIGKNEE